MNAKILCFHGFATNAEFMRLQLQISNFERNFHKLVQFHAVDGTHSIPRHEDATPEMAKAPFYAWWNSKTKENGKRDYQGWAETATYIEDTFKQQGPFDGVLGFSQGACLVSTLVGLQQQGMLLQDIPAIKFAILIGGFRSRFDGHRDAYKDPMRCPSLHIFGTQDPITVASRKLTEAFLNPVVVEHPGGHVIPRLDSGDQEKVIDFVTSAMAMPKL